VQSIEAPVNGTINIATDGSFTYTPDAGFVGQEVLTYTISDGAETAQADVTFNVTNDAPVAVDDSYSIEDGEALNVAAGSGLLANDTDPDGDPLQVQSIEAPVNGTINIATDGSFTYTPDAGFVGQEVLTYTISDGAETAQAEVTIKIDPVNADPIAVGDSYTTDEDTTLSVAAASGVLGNDTDVDGDPLTVTSVNGDSVNVGSQFGLTSGALLTVNSDGSIIYNPNGQFDGLDAGESDSDSFTYTVADGQGGTATETATITINGITDDVLPMIFGTEDSDTLMGRADAELFKGLGGDLDIFTGGGGADRFDFTGLHDDGDRDAARILDWSDDDALLGISPDDVLAIRGRPGLLLLSYGQDQDKLILSGSDISGMETLEDLLGSENEQGTSIG
jgi:VCBS repeat-containing protein